MYLGSKVGSCAKDREAWRENARPYFPQRENDKMMMMNWQFDSDLIDHVDDPVKGTWQVNSL